MAPDDDFESFRATLADLDPATEQRIRRRFESLRERGSADASTTATPDDAHADVIELTALPTSDADREPQPRHSHRVLMGVAAVVALLALIGIVTLVRNADDSADVSSSVDDVPLTEMATQAAAQPDRDLLPGQYLYRAMTEGSTYEPSDPLAGGHATTRSEWWLNREGTGLNRIDEVTWEATSPGQAQATASTEPRDVVASVPQPFMNPGLSYEQLRALPSEPDALLAAVREANGGDLGDSALDAQTLAWWLAIDTVPPEVRGAAFSVLSSLGAEPIGRITTPGGAEGVGYQGTGADGRPWLVVVDPTSTRLLAFALRAGTGDRTWIDAKRFYEYGEQRIVDSLPN